MNEDMMYVVNCLIEKLNQHDVDGAADLFADDATLNLPGMPSQPLIISGREQIKRWLSGIFTENIHLEPRNLRELGDTVIWNADVHVNTLASLGFETLPIEYEAKIEDGKVKTLTARMSDEGMRIVTEVLQRQTTT